MTPNRRAMTKSVKNDTLYKNTRNFLVSIDTTILHCNRNMLAPNGNQRRSISEARTAPVNPVRGPRSIKLGSGKVVGKALIVDHT